MSDPEESAIENQPPAARRRPAGPRRTRFPWRGRVRRPPRRFARISTGESLALRAIIVIKAVKSAALLVIGLALLAMIGRDLGDLATRVAEALNLDIHRRFVLSVIERASNVGSKQVAVAAAGAIAYAFVLGIEAWGLARRRAWAAWLSVGVGAVLLPVELRHFIHKPGVRIAVAFAINLAIVLYLAKEARRATREESVEG